GATGTLNGVAFLLFIAVATWTAGFDIIYATQDADYDKSVGLFSIPSHFGIKKALMMAKGFHVITFIALLAVYFVSPLGWLYLIGVFICGGIMVYEHSLVSPDDLSKVNVAFFTMNGI